MEKEKKVTKLEVLNAITNYFLSLEGEVDLNERVSVSDVLSFAQTQAEQLQKKATREKEKAEEKKAQPDELLLEVQDLLTSEYQSAATILQSVETADATKAKVTNRLSKLVSLGVAEKTVQKEDKKQVTVYKLIAE